MTSFTGVSRSGVANVERDLPLVADKVAAFAHPVHQIVNGISLRQQVG
ncbi:Uncharacterised protein [Klebsiella grimontii]|uniref:Uncharacterized protein n=1 Tax=Klebsiella grimontii TaxID=2058152 RepID=A0A7H4P745_9ENTR|nr:Uncharacterised protein [Klebsiella grimontii]